ncbi:hypothetical protein PA598K_04573 [Paenibacillus sp. 598K]|uniref:DUF294 nucleotidyltransferase-like domain-containing protein n=1 Tax=Paenibacillus sp. 598K TaxID=1117987 RepID=UPI000FFA7CF0|nr:DUF294 nucleotidyltransferase-like domain-containing protein [Paenibacillus sp. 598K]GBF76125.1 hypothetical protein PA598K_04573 [Paenibacillus sp. 598K]
MRDPSGDELLQRIGAADGYPELRRLRDQAHEWLEPQLSSMPVEQLYTAINEVHDALIQRVLTLTESDMARLGNGSPPVPYAYLLFGSGGRKEQTLSSDQDSGIVYEDPPKAQRAETAGYFSAFGQLVVDHLQLVGYPPCEGNVISSNPLWCDTIEGWSAKLEHWFEQAEFEDVRHLLIIADGRCLYGEPGLAARLQDHFYSDMLARPPIVKRMLDNTMRHKMLLGLFGQLLKEQYGEEAGSVDIKYGAYIPMVNAIRMMAIQSGVRATSTLERLVELETKGALTGEQAETLRAAFRSFLQFRMMTMKQQEDGLYSSNGMLSRQVLDKTLTEQLKQGLRVGKRLQRSVSRQVTGKLR